MFRATDRMRCYVARILHGVAGILIIGWTLSHWMTGLSGAFGPTGILSVMFVPGLIVKGGLLAGVRRQEQKIRGRRSPPGIPAGRGVR
jgi:hypothetical protein